MYNLNKKLKKEIEKAVYEIVDLQDKKVSHIFESGIEANKAFMEFREMDNKVQSLTNYYHLLQGFAAGVKYATNRRSKKNDWYVPDRYSEMLKSLLDADEAESLSRKN